MKHKTIKPMRDREAKFLSMYLKSAKDSVARYGPRYLENWLSFAFRAGARQKDAYRSEKLREATIRECLSEEQR